MTPEQREERDPAAIQQEILELVEGVAARQESMQANFKAYSEAKTAYEVDRLWVKLAKERIKGLQSVLKSVSSQF